MITITELKLTPSIGKPKTLRAVKAADPERPCVGCALRDSTDCPWENNIPCEDIIEDGYHFEEIDNNETNTKGETK